MNEPKISVIVPVYKVEKYLRKCVDSIINQTYQNLEIILVDDGSPDNCPAICDEYAAKDSRVRVIHKENGGLGDARNAGLDACTGEYIGFVDSDDWIDANMYSDMATMMEEKNLDVVCAPANIVENGQIIDIRCRYYPDGSIVDSMEIARRCLVNEIQAYLPFKLFRRNCWESLRFPVNCIFEDVAISFRPYLNASRPIGFLDRPYYYYVKNQDGLTFHRKPLTLYHLFLGNYAHFAYAEENCESAVQQCAALTARFALGTYIDYYCGGISEVKPYVKEVEQFLSENQYILKNDQYMQRAWRIGLKLYYFSKPLFRFVYKIFIKVRGARATDEK